MMSSYSNYSYPRRDFVFESKNIFDLYLISFVMLRCIGFGVSINFSTLNTRFYIMFYVVLIFFSLSNNTLLSGQIIVRSHGQTLRFLVIIRVIFSCIRNFKKNKFDYDIFSQEYL